MNSDAISKLEEQIAKREINGEFFAQIGNVEDCMPKLCGSRHPSRSHCLAREGYVNCFGLWPYRLGFPFLGVAWLLVCRDKMLDYLKCCKDQDEDIEKLEALKEAAGPNPARVHTNPSMIVLLLVVLNVIGYIFGNVLFKAACDRP